VTIHHPALPATFHTVASIREALHPFRNSGKRIGFVPTMGALHEGHLSLIKQASQENDCVVCSIFVNPTQFNDAKDLAAYPRMPEDDLRLLDSVSCNMAFLPEVSDIYPSGPDLLDIHFGSLEIGMEGAFRPGHFTGMATVVKRLLDIVEPHRAYFGEKDFQQLAIVRNMVKRLEVPVEIIGCSTLREPDGLAMSSRNLLLSADTRKAAPLIYKALRQAAEHIPHMTPEAVKALVNRFVEQSPLLKVQYFELVDPNTLVPVANWNDHKVVQGCIAVLTDGPRLIDNITYTVE
jgi:pantoate--beta-alanine ligase